MTAPRGDKWKAYTPYQTSTTPRPWDRQCQMWHTRSARPPFPGGPHEKRNTHTTKPPGLLADRTTRSMDTTTQRQVSNPLLQGASRTTGREVVSAKPQPWDPATAQYHKHMDREDSAPTPGTPTHCQTRLKRRTPTHNRRRPVTPAPPFGPRHANRQTTSAECEECATPSDHGTCATHSVKARRHLYPPRQAHTEGNKGHQTEPTGCDHTLIPQVHGPW